MPRAYRRYRGSRNVRRSRFKRRRYYGRGRRASFKRRVGRVIDRRAEHKFTDTYLNIDSEAGYEIHQLCADPTQGDTDRTRNGDVIKVKSVQVRGFLQLPTGVSAETWNKVRVLMFCWRNNDVPLIGQILQNSAINADLFCSPFHRYNLEAKHLIPMYDKSFTINQYNNPAWFRKWMFFGKRLPKKIRRYIDTGVGAEWKHYMLIIHDSFLTPHVNGRFFTRMTYVDY